MLPFHQLPTEKPYAFKSRTELVIDQFAQVAEPSEADLNRVVVAAQVEQGLLEMMGYVDRASSMSRSELEKEVHDSAKLGQRMEASRDEKPHSKCHAHAIVSGGHLKAARLRGILAKYRVRIDDPDNGCWLPENTAALSEMPRRLRSAVPHSRIHRNNYYFWLDSYIKLSMTKDETYLRFQLSMVEQALQAGTMPSYVMEPASKERRP